MKYILLFFISLFCFSLKQVIATEQVTAEEETIAEKNVLYPYQNCNTKNTKFTKSIVSALPKYPDIKTEADYCVKCDTVTPDHWTFQDVQELIKNYTQVHKSCFMAMAVRGNTIFDSKQYKHCETKESTQISHYRKLCANEPYIDNIQKAFNHMSKCFNFTLERQHEILAIINHESGGILNMTSTTGARCLGQLTKDHVNTLNNRIQSINGDNPLPYSEVYEKVLGKCPHIKDIVLDPNLVKQKTSYLTCQVTRDPYACLFYTFFGLEVNRRKIHDNLNSVTDNMGTKELSDKDKTKFKLPIKVNEMLVVTAKIDGKKKTFTFWDDLELYDAINNKKNNGSFKNLKSENMTIQKIPLFKETKQVETMLGYLTHNAGGSYAGHRLISMVEEMKKGFSQPCQPTDKTRRCELRKKLQQGKSLTAKDILPVIEADLKINYPGSIARRHNVANYIRNIVKSSKNVFGYTQESEATNIMLNSYQKSVKFGKEQSLSREDAKKFQKMVSQKCPQVDLKID